MNVKYDILRNCAQKVQQHEQYGLEQTLGLVSCREIIPTGCQNWVTGAVPDPICSDEDQIVEQLQVVVLSRRWVSLSGVKVAEPDADH
jgi:hypothetical protein